VSLEMVSPVISGRLLHLFVEALTGEIGADKLPQILSRIALPLTFLERDALIRLDGGQAAELYASLQLGLRQFYGRGARGILLRVGRRMWDQLTLTAYLREKAEFEIARRLPIPARRRRILNLVAERLRDGGGSVSIHTLDLDLMLMDHSAAATAGQISAEPICFTTLGLIQGAFVWATDKEADIEEIACKAAGAPACEFKVKFGGK
jgi:predicted hydrocarbon binding protein